MSSRDDLKLWAENIVIDPVYSSPQRTPIEDEYWLNGWLRDVPVSAQELNQLFYLITDILKNDSLAVSANLSDVQDKDVARTNMDLLQKSLNFSDVPDKAAARANLELNTVLFNEFFDKIYPVGTVYENKTNGANPSTYLGRGTWVAEGAGRVAIGAGSGTDINGTVQVFNAGTTGGEYSHELTETEIPSHSHTLTTYDDQETGVAGNDIAGTPITGQSGQRSTDATGGGQKHNNIQPYITYYRWLRTA